MLKWSSLWITLKGMIIRKQSRELPTRADSGSPILDSIRVREAVGHDKHAVHGRPGAEVIPPSGAAERMRGALSVSQSESTV